MVAITASSGTGVFTQTSMSQARLERARREADQAETTARQLRAAADLAEEDSQKSQRNLRQIVASVQQQKATVTLTTTASPANTPVLVVAAVQSAVEKLYGAGGPTPTSTPASGSGNVTGAAIASVAATAAIVNTQGQGTGRVVNVRA